MLVPLLRKGNFSIMMDVWIFPQVLRYGLRNVVQVKDMFFYVDGRTAVCLHHFDFLVSASIEEIFSSLTGVQEVSFKYINCEGKAFSELKKNEGNREIISWYNPVCAVKEDHVLFKSRRLQRSIRRIQALKSKHDYSYEYSDGDMENSMRMYLDIMSIDESSWKREKNSDMFSLDREDIVYILGMAACPTNYSFLVLKIDGIPAAYSIAMLWNGILFSVKIGSRDDCRKFFAGVDVVVTHMEHMLKQRGHEIELVDFWGRDSELYNQMASSSILRCHMKFFRGEVS